MVARIDVRDESGADDARGLLSGQGNGSLLSSQGDGWLPGVHWPAELRDSNRSQTNRRYDQGAAVGGRSGRSVSGLLAFSLPLFEQADDLTRSVRQYDNNLARVLGRFLGFSVHGMIRQIFAWG
jgi:hypothetical protein